MPISNYYEEALLTFIFRSGGYGYLALYTTAPAVNGLGGVEVSATGYAPIIAQLDTATWNAWTVANGITNAVAITGPVMSAAAGTVVMVGLLNTEFILTWLSEPMSVAFAANSYASFAIGALSFKLRAS